MQPFCQLMTHYVITFQLADVQLMMAGADGESMNTITVCHNNATVSLILHVSLIECTRAPFSRS